MTVYEVAPPHDPGTPEGERNAVWFTSWTDAIKLVREFQKIYTAEQEITLTPYTVADKAPKQLILAILNGRGWAKEIGESTVFHGKNREEVEQEI